MIACDDISRREYGVKFLNFSSWSVVLPVSILAIAFSAMIPLLVFRVLDQAEELISCSNTQCDEAIFSALRHDDDFGCKVVLQNGEWIKFKTVHRMRKLWQGLHGDGYFYATASDGRRIKKKCFNFNLDSEMVSVASHIQKRVNPKTNVDDVLSDSSLSSCLHIDMKSNCDDFRPATFRGTLEEYNKIREVDAIKPEDLGVQ